MMTRANNPIYRWLVFVCVLLASGPFAYTAIRHAIAEHWAASSDADLWPRAAALEPANADHWYRLGRYRELDFEHGDVPLAISYYRRATSIEPGNALFWLDLAGAYESAGDLDMAEQAYRRAQQAYPISGEVAWRYGNFLLRQDRTEEAFRQIRHAVSVDPELATLAVSRCWRSTQNVDQIVNMALPADPETYWGAIRFFISVPQPQAAMAVWKRLASQPGALSLSRASQLMDLLIQSGHIDDAMTIWRQSLSAAGAAPFPNEKSLVWDGGFEGDLLNVGFAWRYQPIQGAEVGWDEETMHSGSRSLRITFDGSEKMNFQQIWQYVAVKPNTMYRFSAYVRTQELNTDSGIRFDIYDTMSHRGITSTSNVVGTQPWSLLECVFSTSAQTHLLQISLHRDPSEVLTSKLEGTVWVDDVSLVPTDSLEDR